MTPNAALMTENLALPSQGFKKKKDKGILTCNNNNNNNILNSKNCICLLLL